jgi:DNA-binding MarR family transcriptional regulator
MEITSQAGKAPLLRNLPSRLLGQTAALVSKVASDALAAEGAHRHQFAVLATLDAFGASSQAELCRRTDIDRSDMNAVINALEAEGLVTRTLDPGNRRQNIVEMTEAGRSRFDGLRSRLTKAQDHALAPLNEAERRELLRLLQILHDHLAPQQSSTD